MAGPVDPNDRSLLSSIFISADTQAYEQARDLWAMTGLPEPEDGEYFSGTNADRVYLNDHGLCFSFVYRRANFLGGLLGSKRHLTAPVFEARRLRDDRILQPLFQMDLGHNCCFEIVPGVEKVGAQKDMVRSLARELKGDNIHFYAPEPEYVGHLRLPGGGEHVNLIVNRRSIKPISADALVTELPADSLQETIYGGLRASFAEAFERGSTVNIGKIMTECAKIAALPSGDTDKILHTHWTGDGPVTYRRTQIAEAARNYAMRLNP